MVPEGWKRVPIKDVCESIIDCVNKTAPVVDYETPFKMIRTTNVRNGRVDTENVRYVTEDIYQQWVRRGKPQTGDIIFTREAPVGEVGILDNADGVFLGQRTMMYRANLNLSDNCYVFYSLLSVFCQKQIEDFSNGGTVAHMRVPDCGEILINLPPLPEQKKIAQILSTWDKAITTTQHLLANSQQQKKALMQQLLTGKKRLLDKNGERFKGGWELCFLRDVSLCITKGTTPSTNGFEFKENGIPFVKVESIREDGSINRAKLAYIDEECHQAFKRSQLRPGDVLFSIAGALGRVALVPVSLVTANTNQAVCLIRLKQDYLDQSFAYFILQSPKIRREIAAETAQAAQPNLSLKNVGDFKIPVPTMEEQQKIAAVLSNADQEITTLQQKLEALKQEKQALMQQLLTGKRRVKVA